MTDQSTPRLFIAVDLPDDALTALVRLQPPATPGLRLFEPNQMHITVHFLGEADVERTASALATVVTPPFRQSFAGVGQFPSAGGSTTLWAGLRTAPELLQLRSAVATALAPVGFQPEPRPYSPHLTLARCAPGFSTRVIEEFLEVNSRFSLTSVPITAFGLYSSTFFDNIPVYRREREFPLRP